MLKGIGLQLGFRTDPEYFEIQTQEKLVELFVSHKFLEHKKLVGYFLSHRFSQMNRNLYAHRENPQTPASDDRYRRAFLLTINT